MPIQIPKLMFTTKSEYKEYITKCVNKLIQDELTAASLYVLLSNLVHKIDISKEILQHSVDEFDHYTKLIKFATSHKLNIDITIDKNVFANYPSSTRKICEYIQKLEQDAIDNYKNVSLVSRRYNDLETFTLMSEIMNDEIEHFDDIAIYLSQYRDIQFSNSSSNAKILFDGD